MTEKEGEIKYDDRRKILKRKQIDSKKVYGDKKYGTVEITFHTELTNEGVKKVIAQMQEDKKQFKQDLEKQKDKIKGAKKQKELDEDSIKKLNKEINLIKKTVGSRVNFTKNNEKKTKLDGKDKKKQGTGKSDKNKQ